ncbi:unnamed protein product, partial [Rotaria sp. Silwood2]
MYFFFVRLPSIATSPLPSRVRTAMNNVRNFITRSTDNINTVFFPNAQSTAVRDLSIIVKKNIDFCFVIFKEPAVVFPNPMYAATLTASNQPAQLTTSSDEPAKLNVKVRSAPSKP